MVTAPTLGTGENVAVIYERGGTRRLFDVPAVASLEWARNLDAISRSTITTSPARGERAWADCCAELSQVQPWAHEVVMYRDDERVWEGPVRRVLQNRAGVQIIASDVVGWSERKVQAANILATVGLTPQMTTLLTAVLASVANVTKTVGGTPSYTVPLDVKAGGYWSALLSTLTGAGLSFTTVGRRVLYWDDPAYSPGATAILNPERHLIGDVETAREGDDLADKVYATNDQGELGSASTPDTYYGGVERSFAAAGVVGAAALNAVAARLQAARYPMPESLTIPDGSTLNCDAPFPIGVLVPGVLTPVKVTDLCWPVEQTMMLTDVRVTQDGNGEKVGVSYAPIADVGGE